VRRPLADSGPAAQFVETEITVIADDAIIPQEPAIYSEGDLPYMYLTLHLL
jgi:hypothetical protein